MNQSSLRWVFHQRNGFQNTAMIVSICGLWLVINFSVLSIHAVASSLTKRTGIMWKTGGELLINIVPNVQRFAIL